MTANEKAAQLIVDYQLTYRDAPYVEALNSSVRVCQELIYELKAHKASEQRVKYWQDVEQIIKRNY